MASWLQAKAEGELPEVVAKVKPLDADPACDELASAPQSAGQLSPAEARTMFWSEVRASTKDGF